MRQSQNVRQSNVLMVGFFFLLCLTFQLGLIFFHLCLTFSFQASFLPIQPQELDSCKTNPHPQQKNETVVRPQPQISSASSLQIQLGCTTLWLLLFQSNLKSVVHPHPIQFDGASSLPIQLGGAFSLPFQISNATHNILVIAETLFLPSLYDTVQCPMEHLKKLEQALINWFTKKQSWFALVLTIEANTDPWFFRLEHVFN